MPRFLATHLVWTGVLRYANKLRGRRNIHLLHIGKTGGTAVKAAVRALEPSETSLIIHPHEVLVADIPPGDGIIFFVRDPLSRFTSGFFSRKRQGFPAHNKRWSAAERDAFARFETPGKLASALSSSDPDMRVAAEQVMCAIEHVRSSYWDWFGSKQQFEERWHDFVFIGQQESLQQDFERLKCLMEWPMEMRLPVRPELSHKSPDGEDRAFGEQARRNLKRWYRRDYEFLAMCAKWRETVLDLPFRVGYDLEMPEMEQFE